MDKRNYLIFISALTLFSCGKQYGTEPQDDFVNAEVISSSYTRVSTGGKPETGLESSEPVLLTEAHMSPMIPGQKQPNSNTMKLYRTM